MATFVESGIYLKFGDKPRAKCRPLLWPVLVHRVLYPEVRRPLLNLFQRAVFGLIRARTTRVDDIAELTDLHPSLIRLILAQGVSNDWLTPEVDALTEKGQRLLDDEEEERSNLKSGYLLQDAITGQLWPRMVGKLNEMEAKDPAAQYPEFMAERKTGKLIKPFVLRCRKRELPPVDNQSLMAAYRDYQEDFRFSQQLGLAGQLPAQIRLLGVQRLDDTPWAARALIWVTANEEGAELWSVKDPLVLRDEAWWLQEPLKQMVEQDTKLLGRLAPLVGIPQSASQSVEEWLASLQKQTDLQVLIEYPWVERQPDIKRYLAALLAREEKLLQGDCGEHELAAAMMECQKLLEVVMQWLIRTYPADVGQLPKQRRYDAGLNRRILSAMDIPAFTEDVIGLLAGQKIDQVIRACTSPSSSLKALLFSAAMGAFAMPQHPLKQLNARDLQLQKLLELADLRNQSSHGQSRFTGRPIKQLTKQMAQDGIQYALSFTARFKEWM